MSAVADRHTEHRVCLPPVHGCPPRQHRATHLHCAGILDADQLLHKVGATRVVIARAQELVVEGTLPVEVGVLHACGTLLKELDNSHLWHRSSRYENM